MSNHRRLAIVALAAAPCIAWADTPNEVYQRDLACASAASAAKADTRDRASPDARTTADKLAVETLDVAKTSGAKAGVASARVVRAVDGGRDRLLVDLRQPDKAKADNERADMGKFLIDCALLHAMTK